MLDLAFLVLMIIALLKSIKGDFNLLMCNIATVVGIVAAIVGMIKAFFSSFGWFNDGMLNIVLLFIALLVKPAAKYFAKLYQDKIDEEIRRYNEEAERANENFFRKGISDNAYLHAAERGTDSPDANMQATGEIPQGYNGGTARNTAFPQNGNPAASPMAANSAVFPQNGNMAAVDADSPKMEGISPISKTILTQPDDLEEDDNSGLPYDLSAPINLDHGIDDISVDDKK